MSVSHLPRRPAMLVVSLTFILLSVFFALSLVAGASPAASTTALTSWTLQGRVYEGDVDVEDRPLQGVVVSLYAGSGPYPAQGWFVRSTTTDAQGWYGLPVWDDDITDTVKYFHIRETDPFGYTSVGATTVGGTRRTNNWIEYTTYGLTTTVLTGNKFWDRGPATSTPTATGSPPPPTQTYTPSPTDTMPATSTPTPTGSPPPPTQTYTPTTTGTMPATSTPTPTGSPPPPTQTYTPTSTATRTGEAPRRWEFSGEILMAVEPPHPPAPDVAIGLFGSNEPEELGVMLAETVSDELGTYTLAFTSTVQMAAMIDYAYVNVAVVDPAYRVVHAESGSGGTSKDQGWIQFPHPDPDDYAENNFFVEPADVIVRRFGGQVIHQPPGEPSEPAPHVPVGVFKAYITCEEGTLVAEGLTDEFGHYDLEHVTSIEEDAPYYNLIVLDPDFHVIGTESGSGGYGTNQGWIQYAEPSAGEFGGNEFHGQYVFGEQVIAAATQDSYVSRQSAGSNYGTSTQLLTAYSTGPDSLNERVYMSFDLQFIPQDATIMKATLYTYLEGAGGEEKVCMSLHRVTNAWLENAITWNSQPNYTGVPIATHYVDKTLGYKSWDVTSTVQDWMTEYQAAWKGFALLGPEEGKAWSRRFSSREGSHPPQLVIQLHTTSPFQTPTPTATVTPTSTPTDVPTPVSRQVQGLGVEVNQAIQDINTTKVNLIAGKPAVVRVHLKVVDGKGNIPNVYGEMHLPLAGGPIYNALNTMTVRSNPNRGVFSHSLNFTIPASDAQGTKFMFIRIFPPAGISFSSLGELQETRQLTFHQTPPLRVVFVPITYTMNSTIRTPRAGAMDDARSWLRRAYPVPNVQSMQHPVTLTMSPQPYAMCSSGGWATVNNQLATLRSTSNTSLGANTIYFGMVPDDYESLCTGLRSVGRANGIPSTESAGSMRSGATFVGTNAGHEIGHNLNRYHAEFCGAKGGKSYPHPNGDISPSNNSLFGIDIQTHQVYPPSSKDLMTYCGSQWVSDFTYNGLRSRITQFPLLAAAQGPEEEMLVISGLINRSTGQTTLDPLYKVSVPAPPPSEPGDCAIVLRDAGGGVLAEHEFAARIDTQPMDGQDNIETTHELVPAAEGLAQVDVYCDEELLATQTASANPSTVRVLSPNGDEVWGIGPQTITWQADDADGGDLRFLAQFSADDGETWTTLMADLAGTSYTFGGELLAGSEAARIRVIATDGLLTAQDTSDGSFTVEAKPPRVTIDWPADGSTLLIGQSHIFTGYAYDPDEGTLEEEALRWLSDWQGELGAGQELLMESLLPGAHEITLTATDGDEMQGEATIEVFVGVKSELPLILK